MTLNVLNLNFISFIFLVHHELEGTIKNIVGKSGFNVLLAYHIQFFLIVTKLPFSSTSFHNLQKHAQIF
jgi:hypothetical protein